MQVVPIFKANCSMCAYSCRLPMCRGSLQLQEDCGPFCHAGAPQCAACLGDGAEIILNYYICIQTITFAFLFPVILFFGYQAF